jgi:hypothetical protein
MELVTVRIPELIKHPGPLSLEDRLPIWYKAINKTRYTELQDIRDLILTGGTGAALPVIQSGDSMIHIVTASESGGNIVSIPALAGKTFKLRRRGQPLIPQTGTTPSPTDEYVCLNAGGFQLLQAGDVVLEGERYELEVFALQGGNISGPSSGGSALITGQVVVTTNFTIIPADHLNKLISIRADNSIITVTLPDVLDVPDNTIIPIEASILNNWQARITTQNSQYIYMRNNNYTSVYMGKSESLWLYRADDGWYDINQFGRNYDGIGRPQASYEIGLNELLCDGSILSRDGHPRLWERVQTFGSSLVSEATWLTATATVQGRTVELPYRGCFSTGDGSTNFRLPNLMGVALRGLTSTSGSDPARHHNKAGGFQRHDFEAHTHGITYELNGTDGQNNGQHIYDNSGPETNPTGTNTFAIQSTGGSETRMDNVGVLWVIKE